MIFCTMGTTPFPFKRMTGALDVSLKGNLEKLIVQKEGKEIPFSKMVFYVSHARALICHGGAGTVLMALQYASVKPFVVPRLSRLGEHVDDHQLYFSKFMHEKGYIVMPRDFDHITDDLRTYLRHPPRKKHKDLSAGAGRLELVRNLSNFLDQ